MRETQRESGIRVISLGEEVTCITMPKTLIANRDITDITIIETVITLYARRMEIVARIT